MNSLCPTLPYVETAFGVLIAVFGFLFAAFELRERWLTSGDQVREKAYYYQLWARVQGSSLIQLPEQVIFHLLVAKTIAVERIMQIFEALTSRILVPVGIAAPILCLIPAWHRYGWPFALPFFAGPFPFAILLVVVYHFKWRIPYRYQAPIGILALISYFVSGIIWLSVIIELSIGWAVVASIVALPLLGLLIAWPLAAVWRPYRRSPITPHPYEEPFLVFGVAATISFVVTLTSLWVGHVAESNSAMPQTMQLLVANVVCDGLTAVATISLLQWALRSKRTIMLLLAVLLDFFLAGFLAVASLYLGLRYSDYELTVESCLHILIGLSPHADRVELGSEFFAMHTAFIPTVAYLAMIALLVLLRAFVWPVGRFAQRASILDQPHRLTAGLLLLMSAACLGVLEIVKIIKRIACS